MTRENWVKSLGLETDGTLLVEMDNGIRFFDLSPIRDLPAAVSIPPEDLMKAENRRLYYRFLATLKEIEAVFINSVYDGLYPFKNGDIVVDAGARIGTFSAKISAAVGETGRIIAIEPESRSFACLQKNITANCLHNVIPIQKALWSGKQSMRLYLSADGSAHSAFCDAFYGSTGESVPVEAEALDNILESLGIGAADFIKMDIEGAEVEALKGMRNTLKSYPEMAIAAYHPVKGFFAHTVITPQLEQLGFTTSFADGIVRAGGRKAVGNAG
ncbi:MAG: FkbM family methyltransferase [Acidobacteria bacterium]|nr:FkbM family methyltransferase [Acidobacteriota bacterium]